VLSLCATPVHKTLVLRTVNINMRQFRKYAACLIDNGLLVEEDKTYTTTENGANFVQQYAEIAALFPRDLSLKGKQ
jgi:predicted transcriptional regulator